MIFFVIITTGISMIALLRHRYGQIKKAQQTNLL